MKLEADFTQYYNRNLQDYYDPNKKMTLRWVAVHAAQLSPDSRTKMAARKDNLTQDQHISLDAIDLLNQIAYFTIVHLRTQIAKEADLKKIVAGAPKPLVRNPQNEKKKDKPAFLTGRQLREMTMTTQTKSIAHTDGCIKSKLFADTGKCGCPVEGGEK